MSAAYDLVIFAGPSFGPGLQSELEKLGHTSRLANDRGQVADLLRSSSRALLFVDARLDPLSFAQPGRVEVVPVGPLDPLVVTDSLRRGAVDWVGVPLAQVELVRVLENHRRRVEDESALRAKLQAEVSAAAPSREPSGMDPTAVAATVLHEVNNPLTALMAYMEDLRLSIDRQRFGRARESINAMEATLDHLRTVARSGRTLLRKQSGPGSVMAAIQAATVMVGRKNPKVTTNIDVNTPPVKMPIHQLAQVLLNLIINAGHAGSRTVVVSAIHRGERVLVDVIDDGAGMDEAVRQRALETGYTTKGDEGSGVGLSMVHRLTQECGGSMELMTQAGTGTQVRLHLPVAPPEL